MKILITGAAYAPAFNGQAIFTTTLAEGLASCGHQVYVITTSGSGKAYQIVHNGVHINSVFATELKFLHSEAYAPIFPDAEVKRTFETFSPDILHIQDHYPLSRICIKYARRQGIPVLGTNHFMPDNFYPYVPIPSELLPTINRIMWGWMHGVFNHIDFAVAPSKTAVEILKTNGLKIPIRPISCGVDPKRFYPDRSVKRHTLFQRYGLDESRITFLFVGRVDGEKRIDVIIKAVKKLNRPDIQVAVTGKGAALHNYQELARELNVTDQIRFTGFVPDADLPLLLNCTDIFIMPSEAELLSIASLEAMATGLPLLAARAKALPELVNDGVNGYLFTPGDASDAAHCMAILADHPERWPEMGAASLEKVQPHHLNNVLTSYEELYEYCINHHKKNS